MDKLKTRLSEVGGGGGTEVNRETYMRDQTRLERIYAKYGSGKDEGDQSMLRLESASQGLVSPSSSARISSPIQVPSHKREGEEGTR